MTTTATLAELDAIDDAERILIRSWSTILRARKDGTAPVLVESLIVGALHYEPRFALTFSPCMRVGCDLFVDDRETDEHGRIWCGESCRDADAEDAFELQQSRLLESGWFDVHRRSGPPGVQLFPFGVDPWGPR